MNPARSDSRIAAEMRGDALPLTDQLANGLRWLAAHHDYETREQRATYRKARARWMEKAEALEKRDGLPAGYVSARLDLAEALLEGRAARVEVVCGDGGRRLLGLTSGRLPGHGQFALPCRLELADGSGATLVRELRGNGTDVLGVLDACELLPVAQRFPGCQVLGAEPPEQERQSAPRQETLL